MEEYPDNPNFVYERGTILYKQNKMHLIEQSYISALQLGHPDRFNIFLRLGKAYQSLELWGNSKAAFCRACAINKTSSVAWLGLGIVCMRREDWDDAEHALSQANLFDHNNTRIWGYLALLSLSNGRQIEKANQCLREMLKYPNSDASLLKEIISTITFQNQRITAFDPLTNPATIEAL